MPAPPPPDPDALAGTMKSAADLVRTYVSLGLTRRSSVPDATLPFALSTMYALTYAYLGALHAAVDVIEASAGADPHALARARDELDGQMALVADVQALFDSPQGLEDTHTALQHFLHDRL